MLEAWSSSHPRGHLESLSNGADLSDPRCEGGRVNVDKGCGRLAVRGASRCTGSGVMVRPTTAARAVPCVQYLYLRPLANEADVAAGDRCRERPPKPPRRPVNVSQSSCTVPGSGNDEREFDFSPNSGKETRLLSSYHLGFWWLRLTRPPFHFRAWSLGLSLQVARAGYRSLSFDENGPDEEDSGEFPPGHPPLLVLCASHSKQDLSSSHVLNADTIS